MRVYKQFTFDAAHCLPFLPEGHKCKRPHGHTYHVELQCEATADAVESNGGFVVDYADITAAWLAHVDAVLDHRDLNLIVRPSTCENLAVWIWEHLKPVLPSLCKVRLGETATAGVEYDGQ